MPTEDRPGDAEGWPDTGPMVGRPTADLCQHRVSFCFSNSKSAAALSHQTEASALWLAVADALLRGTLLLIWIIDEGQSPDRQTLCSRTQQQQQHGLMGAAVWIETTGTISPLSRMTSDSNTEQTQIHNKLLSQMIHTESKNGVKLHNSVL